MNTGHLTPVDKFKRAYHELYLSLNVWKYGSVIDIVDPLGLKTFPGTQLVRPGRDLGDRSLEELQKIEDCYQSMRHALDNIRPHIRATWRYDEPVVLTRGEAFDPRRHQDLYVDNIETKMNDTWTPVVAEIMWYGIQNVTKSIVVCEYDSAQVALAFHEFVMSSQIPRSLKAFIFSRQGMANIPMEVRRHVELANPRFHPYGVKLYNSLTGLLRRRGRDNTHVHTTACKLVKRWMAAITPTDKDYEFVNATGHPNPGFAPSPYDDNPVWTKDEDYMATKGDLDACISDERAASLDDVYVIVEMVMILKEYTKNTGGANPKFRQMAKSDIFPGLGGNDPDATILRITDAPPGGHPLKATLRVHGKSGKEMVRNIQREAHLFVLRVDMSQCDRLSYKEIDDVVAEIRMRSPFVRHVVCHLGLFVNMMPASFASWDTVTMLDTTLSPSIVCAPITLRGTSTPLTTDKFKGVVPHRRGRPPIFVTTNGGGFTEVHSTHLRAISRLSSECPITAKDIMSLFLDVDLMTLDDGPIIQGISTVDGVRCLVTVYGNRDEMNHLVPTCEMAQEACDVCKKTYRDTTTSLSEPEIYGSRRCLVSCPNNKDTEVGSLYRESMEPVSFACESCKKKFGDFDYPLCVSSCPLRRLPLNMAPCDECPACTLVSCECDMFYVDVNLRRMDWREAFAGEMMQLYIVRGFNVHVIIIVDRTGQSLATINEARAFLCDLAPTCNPLIYYMDDVVNGTAIKGAPGLHSAIDPPDSMRHGKYALRHPATRHRAALWVLKFVFTQRMVRGMGIHTIDSIVAFYTRDHMRSTETNAIREMLRALDRMGVVRVISDYVFLSMRHYSMFVNVMMTNPSSVVAVPRARDMLCREIANGSYTYGTQQYITMCSSLLLFMNAQLQAHVGGDVAADRPRDMISVLRMLGASRVASLRAQLAPSDEDGQAST